MYKKFGRINNWWYWRQPKENPRNNAATTTTKMFWNSTSKEEQKYKWRKIKETNTKTNKSHAPIQAVSGHDQNRVTSTVGCLRPPLNPYTAAYCTRCWRKCVRPVCYITVYWNWLERSKQRRIFGDDNRWHHQHRCFMALCAFLLPSRPVSGTTEFGVAHITLPNYPYVQYSISTIHFHLGEEKKKKKKCREKSIHTCNIPSGTTRAPLL